MRHMLFNLPTILMYYGIVLHSFAWKGWVSSISVNFNVSFSFKKIVRLISPFYNWFVGSGCRVKLHCSWRFASLKSCNQIKMLIFFSVYKLLYSSVQPASLYFYTARSAGQKGCVNRLKLSYNSSSNQHLMDQSEQSR